MGLALWVMGREDWTHTMSSFRLHSLLPRLQDAVRIHPHCRHHKGWNLAIVRPSLAGVADAGHR